MIPMTRRAGQSLIEVTVGIVILIPASLILVDLAVVVYGVQLNDSACQNAARAAASGSPSESQFRAQTVVDRMNGRSNGSLVSGFRLLLPVEMKITGQPTSQRDFYTGKQVSQGGLISGTATVTTEADVRPFLVHIICGQKPPFTMRARQTFPISYIMPPS